MSPELMSIFHYTFRQLYIRKKTKSYCLSRLRESFFPCSQIVGSSTILNKKILLFSRNSKRKLIFGHLTAVLVEYARNMLGEQDSFKSFHRFRSFGFVLPLLDHLHIIFLSCTSFIDIFSVNRLTCILFNYQRFSILHIHVCIF